MTRTLLLAPIALALAALPAHAVPTTVTYAGFLTQNGEPVDGTVDLVVELFDDRTGGAAVFSESFQSVIVPDGDLVLELGAQTPLDDALLDTPELWLQATVDGEVLLPRARLASVPYALQAGEAATLEGLTASDIQTQIDAVSAQIAAAQTQLNALQASLTGLATAGGQAVAFANVTGLAFQSPLVFTGGNATVAANGITASHIATDGVGAAEIAAGAVGTSEIANAAVTSTHLSGVESTVYLRVFGCGGGGMTTATTCTTTVCKDGSTVRYMNCAGLCQEDSPLVCNLTGNVGGKILSSAN